MRLSEGESYRHFRVLEKVGEGGMGVVYRARDTKLGRDVALKFVSGGQRTEFADRLLREARSLAALNHPNIVTIYEIGEEKGQPTLVLEWIDGRTLDDPSHPRPMPPPAFLRAGIPVAEALAAAHGVGIIHRDLKPANVIVPEGGGAKLIDFGLARVHDPGGDETRTAGVLGTVAYMSPEQVHADELTPASDVFSFGVMAYELLAGRRPFEGESPGAVLAAITSGRRRPLSELAPQAPLPLVEVVERCLATGPSERYSGGGPLVQALRAAATAGGSGPRLAAISRSSVRLDASGERSGSAPPDQRIEGPRDHGAAGAEDAESVPAPEQEIRYCRAKDGYSIAYAAIGSGPPIVRVLGHCTHLEMEWAWPELRDLWVRLARQHTVVRYDGRGMGLSEPFTGEFTEQTRQADLEAVLQATCSETAILLGISEGGWTAARYAIDHPERVSHLVLYGAYCRGARAREDYDPEEDEALATLIRKGWGRDTPAFRQVFTSQFFRPDADPRLLAHFNEMQRAAGDPDTIARYHLACHRRGDGREMFLEVRQPTLIVHCRDDMAVSADEGRLLASLIPDSRLVLLPSGTHYFPTDDEIAGRVASTIGRFLADTGVTGSGRGVDQP